MTGIVSTSIVQSSTIITLIVLGFIGANLIQFQHAVGVIIGSNIGTTITSWLISIIGFKVDITSLALPFIGIAIPLSLIRKNNKKIYNISMFIFGFGILLIGLGYIQSSFSFENNDISLEQYLHISRYRYILISVIITILTQSSSATTAIVLTALYNKTIVFETAMFLMIGSNIGTTFTGIMAVFGGTSSQKQLALAQVIFKTLKACIIIPFFKPSTKIIIFYYWSQ